MDALTGGSAATWVVVAVFLASLVLTAVSSFVLAADLERVGTRLGLSAALLGLATALGADAPEIASAVAALLRGQHDLGLSIVLGSNVFNLAALLGLSAVVAGQIRIAPQALLLNGVVAVVVAAVAAAVVMGALAPLPSMVVLGGLLVPYVGLSALRPGQVGTLRLPRGAAAFLRDALGHAQEDASRPPRGQSPAGRDALSIVPALAAIVGASFGLVRSAATLGERWGVPHAVVGSLILAGLTGLPNIVAAQRLAVGGRGPAVVSEALNSNTLNVLFGICLPAVVFDLGSVSGRTMLAAWWVVGLTLATTVLTGLRGGLSRLEGAAVMVAYLVFAGLVVFQC